MATKVLSGTYRDGYVLSPKYSSVVVTSSAYIGGVGIGGGLYVAGSATVSNAGTITNVDLYRGKLINTGDINAGAYTYVSTSFNNSGTITGFGGGRGVDQYSGASMTNSGIISGGAGVGGKHGSGGDGIYVYAGGVILKNTGEIIGGQATGLPRYGSVGGNGVDLHGTATILNTGTIAGGSSAFEDGEGVDLLGGGLLTNGSATATAATVSGDVGARLGELGVVVNLGTIVGLDGAGITMAGGGAVTNGDTAVGSALIQGYVGVYVRGASPVTVTNFGTIQGAGGVAVQFKSVADRLIVETGSELLGSARGAGATLELASGRGKIEGLNALGTLSGNVAMTFSGFGAYAIDAGADWTLEGKNSLASDETFTDGGRLTTDGKLINDGLVQTTGSGVFTIMGQLANSGTIAVNGGTVIAMAEITGRGLVSINGGTLDLASSVRQAVTFAGPTGVLEIEKSQSSTLTLTGFSTAGGTSLDLSDIEFVSAREATFSGTKTSGILTVTDGAHTSHITLIGNYIKSIFTASTDGHGGTTVVAGTGEAPHPSPHAFISAMASLGAPPAFLTDSAEQPPAREPMLSGPRMAIA